MKRNPETTNGAGTTNAENYRSRLIDAGLKTRDVLKRSIERHPADVMLLSVPQG